VFHLFAAIVNGIVFLISFQIGYYWYTEMKGFKIFSVLILASTNGNCLDSDYSICLMVIFYFLDSFLFTN
jgi:hypothetical protein